MMTRSAASESFAAPGDSSTGILECPHYTRPAEFRGYKVPETLVSGHHEDVRRWRRRKRNLCVLCGYNLTGNTSGVCPECGKRI